jgi:hypothetical protein
MFSRDPTHVDQIYLSKQNNNLAKRPSPETYNKQRSTSFDNFIYSPSPAFD